MRHVQFLIVLCASCIASTELWAQDSSVESSITFPVEMGDFKLKVLDAEGKPIQDVEVTVNGVRCLEDPGSWYAWPAANGGPKPVVMTDAFGEAAFRFPTKLGSPRSFRTITTLTINFRHADFISERAEVLIDRKGFEQTLKPGCNVTFSAVNKDGEPIEKFGAFISGPGYDAKWTLDAGTIRSSAIPDGSWQTMLVAPREDGVTLFSGILPARYVSDKQVTIRNVVLRQGLRVEGVLSSYVPRPVTDGIVVAFSQPKGGDEKKRRDAIGWSDVAEIREDGTFTFPSLPRGGRLQLIALCRGWVIENGLREGDKQPRGPSMRTGVLINLESANIKDDLLSGVTLLMEQAGAVEVVVKHLDGKPAEGIRVFTSPNQMLEHSGSQLLGSAFASVDLIRSRLDPTFLLPDYWQTHRESRYDQETDADGKATLFDLPLGTWEVYVGNEKFRLVTEEQEAKFDAKIMAKLEKAKTLRVEATVEPIVE